MSLIRKVVYENKINEQTVVISKILHCLKLFQEKEKSEQEPKSRLQEEKK